MSPTVQSLPMSHHQRASGTKQFRGTNVIHQPACMEALQLLRHENRRYDMNAVAAVQAHMVSKSFRIDGQQLPVLYQVSLQVMPGKMVAVMGASGCGCEMAKMSRSRIVPAVVVGTVARPIAD